jgi:hypothetical protein
MNIQSIKSQVQDHIKNLNQFTSRQIADQLWPDLAIVDNRGIKIHPYSAQVSIVLKMIRGIERNKKTMVYKNLNHGKSIL